MKPWKPLFSVWVPGKPKGQPRPRAFARGGKAAVYTPGTAEAWKSSIAVAVKQFLPAVPIAAPVRIDLRFMMPRPKRLMRRKDPDGPIRYDGRPDSDNMEKAVWDALEIVGLYDDDKRICENRTEAFYHEKEATGGPVGRPGCFLTVYVEASEGA